MVESNGFYLTTTSGKSGGKKNSKKNRTMVTTQNWIKGWKNRCTTA
jgi:hypothetical protein